MFLPEEQGFNTRSVTNPRLVLFHPEDRKHFSEQDIDRLERNGFVVVFAANTPKISVDPNLGEEV